MDLFAKMMSANVFAVRSIFKVYDSLKSFNLERRSVKNRMKTLPKEGAGRDLYIILNGPSLKSQDLNKLKGADLMFVNRGFLHPLFKELQPKYHIFVDPKLRDGEWPLEWLDQIFEMCPNIRIILPINWSTLPKFAKYKNDNRIFWQYWKVPFYQLGVSGGCFSYGISQGFDNIYFTGFDANGCAYDMIKQSEESHFYGADPELMNMTTYDHEHALFTTFLHLQDLNDLAKYCKKNNINIFNITNGGLLDMFPRKDFNKVFVK